MFDVDIGDHFPPLEKELKDGLGCDQDKIQYLARLKLETMEDKLSERKLSGAEGGKNARDIGRWRTEGERKGQRGKKETGERTRRIMIGGG